MKTTGNTILITGGGSGIGLETAKLFAEKGNTVIITGRNKARLENAVSGLKNIHFIPCNITDPEEVLKLQGTIEKQFPDLNILVNNAGVANLYKKDPEAMYHNAVTEINTNYLAIVNLVHQFLPLLSKQKEAAIVNVSSIVSFSPSLALPTYSASKAALHSYTIALRQLLTSTNVKVFEVMPPLVDTDMAKDIPSDSKISAAQVASEIENGLSNSVEEIHVGSTQKFYEAFFNGTNMAFKTLNQLE